MVFLNAIDPQTYEHPDSSSVQYDENVLSPSDRITSMYARGKAFHLLQWIFSRYDVVHSDSRIENQDLRDNVVKNPMREILLPHMIALKFALYTYKTAAAAKGFNINISPVDFENQLNLALDCFDGYTIALYQAEESGTQFDSLHWKDYSASNVQVLPKALPEDLDDTCKRFCS